MGQLDRQPGMALVLIVAVLGVVLAGAALWVGLR
jgi:hypothetical protein